MKNLAKTLALLGILTGLDLAFGFDGDAIDAKSNCPEVLKLCTCGRMRTKLWKPKRNDTYVVKCVNTNFSDISVLEQLPKETEVIIFNGNNVDYIPNNVFGIVHEHEVLKVIDFSNNRIETITGKAFHKVSNVEILILNHNDLRISGSETHPRMLTNFGNLRELQLTNAFTEVIDSKYYLEDLQTIIMAAYNEGMDKLQKLHLGQNELWSLNEKSFCNMMPPLTHLYLDNNNLQDLQFGFECIKNLQFLDVSYNKIKRLQPATLQRIGKFFDMPKNENDLPRKINLVGNPFVCDCNLRDMFDWLGSTTANLDRRDNLRCYTGIPEENAGRKILNALVLNCLDSNNVPRSGNHRHSASIGSGTTHTLLVILIILISCLLAVLLYIHKEKVHSNFQTFQRSLQYRTIEKDISENTPIPPEVNV